MTPPEHTDVTHLKNENKKLNLLVRQRLIDAAEGRLVSVVEEFEQAFDILSKYPKTVTVFGSARLPQDDPASKLAFSIGWALAKHDYSIVTGGGHGIMEAANHGAMKAGGTSIGFNIELPMEQKLNDYTTDHYAFKHFFGRKVALTLDASGYVYCAGGFGTLDELFEILTLIQTGKIPPAPVILAGESFWRPLDSFIRQTLDERFETIDSDDTDLYHITDDIDDIVRRVEGFSKENAERSMREQARFMEERWYQMYG